MKTYPIEHISFSATMTYLRNPFEFKRIYIDRNYRSKDSPASLVGRAFHKCCEFYYQGQPKVRAIEGGLQHLQSQSASVDWGKTGSLDKAMQDYNQTVEHYFASEMIFDLENVIATEKVMVGKMRGVKLPVKAVSDLLVRYKPEGMDKRLIIIDFKKVSVLTGEDDGIKPEYYIQAFFNKWAIESTMKESPREIRFLEVKTAKSKEGPQTACIILNFLDPGTIAMEAKIKGLVNSIIREVGKKKNTFLPNMGDMYSGQDTWDEWLKA